MKGKRRTTFEKFAREQRVRERRALKAQRKEERKLEAAGTQGEPEAGPLEGEPESPETAAS